MTEDELKALCRRQLRLVRQYRKIKKEMDENSRILSSREDYVKALWDVISEDQKQKHKEPIE